MKQFLLTNLNNQALNQHHFFDKFEDNTIKNSQENLKNFFEKVDQNIFNSSWRKDQGYIPWITKSRTILTIYGPVTFKRRLYKYWNKALSKWQYVFLADKKLQIERYSRISSHLKFKVLEQVACGKRYRDVCDMFYKVNLSRMTIGKIINTFNLTSPTELLINSTEKVTIPKYLYINIDETYMKLRNNKVLTKYRMRLVTFHTGYKENSSINKRNILTNKRVYLQVLPVAENVNTEKFAQHVKQIADKFYTNVNEVNTIIGGDGASWIRKTADYFPNAFYVLDKFHALRNLKQLFPSRFNYLEANNYQICKNYFNQGKIELLISFLQNMKLQKHKQKKWNAIISYFKNNEQGVRNWNLDWNIGVSAEADISHVIKWLQGYGSKAYNYHTFNNMLLLRVAQINKLDIINYLKTKYQKISEAEREFYWQKNWSFKNNQYYKKSTTNAVLIIDSFNNIIQT